MEAKIRNKIENYLKTTIVGVDYLRPENGNKILITKEELNYEGEYVLCARFKLLHNLDVNDRTPNIYFLFDLDGNFKNIDMQFWRVVGE